MEWMVSFFLCTGLFHTVRVAHSCLSLLLTHHLVKMSFFGTVYYATSLSHCHCSDNYRYASKEIRDSIDGFIGGGRDKKR